MDSRAVLRRTLVLIGVVALTVVVVQGTAAQPAGEAVLAFHVTIAPTWCDPSTAPPQSTPGGFTSPSGSARRLPQRGICGGAVDGAHDRAASVRWSAWPASPPGSAAGG